MARFHTTNSSAGGDYADMQQTEELHEAALAQATDVIARIQPTDLSRPTPCAGWDLAALVMHMIGQNHGFAAALHAGGRRAGPDPSVFAARPVGTDPGPAWRASAAAVTTAFAHAPAGTPVLLPEISPTPLPRETAMRIHLLDTVVHTWDVTTALGRAHRPDAALVAAVLAVARLVPSGPTRTAPGAAFAPPRPDTNSDDWLTALALLGRDGDPAGSPESRVASYERVIQASPEQVFALIADPAAQPRWDGNNNLATAAHGQRVRAVGDRFAMTLTSGAVRENHVVEFEEARRIAWRPAEPGQRPPGHLWRWELAELDDTHTLVRHTYDWTELTDPQRFERARTTTPAQLRASVDRLAALLTGDE